MMLVIRHPDSWHAERAYIIDVLFGEFLGLSYRLETHSQRSTLVSHDADPDGRKLELTDGLFDASTDSWLTADSLPVRPCEAIDVRSLPFEVAVAAPALPVLFGQPRSGSWGTASKDYLALHIDVLGGSFFLLTRYEECVVPDRDRHDRFASTGALAVQAGFHERPLVNEYVEVLWGALRHLWPNLQRRQRRYEVRLSHDVDWPLATRGLPLSYLLRATAGDIAVRRDLSLASRRLASRFQVVRGNLDADMGNTFDFIMDTSEAFDLRSAFYFITEHSGGMIDGTYSIDEPWIRGLLGRVHARGHEIGLHPSYNTYLDPRQTRREFERLVAACDAEGIRQDAWGGRQHYLRWRNPTTWQNWADAGLNYDSTVGFADRVGFRAGTCYDYPVFNLMTRERLSLIERPLVVMDGALFRAVSPANMDLPDEPAFELVRRLKRKCQRFDGAFSLLWHNSALITPRQRRIYSDVIRALVDG